MLGASTTSARPTLAAVRVFPSWWTREQVLSLLAVLLVASALRLPLPDLTPFGHDEALEAIRARPIWYGARPVESEITSWWIPDPAGLLYFFALAEAFPKPAIARVEMVALANVASVLLTYALARRYFGRRVGLVAGLLYAVNPWAVTFGRQPWVITQPLLTTLMLLSAMKVVVDRDRRWLPGFFVALAAQTQTHLLAVLYGPPVALTLLLFARRWLARELAIGVGLALLIVAPFALHLWGIHDSIVEALDRGNRGLRLAPNLAAARLTLWLASGYGIDAKLGLPSGPMEALRGPLLIMTVIAGALLILGIVRAVRACLRRPDGWEAHALLLIWFLGPLLLMTWQSSSVYIHYVLVLLPTPFLLMGVGVGSSPHEERPSWEEPSPRPSPRGRGSTYSLSLWERVGVRAPRQTWSCLATTTGIALICAVHVAAIAVFYVELERSLAAPRAAVSPTEWQAALNRVDVGARQAGIGEIHGLPLRYWQSVADWIKAEAGPRGIADVVVVTGIRDDANRHLDKRRKALEYLLGTELQPRFPLEGLVVSPSQRDVLYVTIPEQELPRPLARAATTLGEAPLPGTDGATRLSLVRARPPREVVPERFRTEARFDAGVRLVGLDPPSEAKAGETVPLISFWHVERDVPAAGEDYEPFLELRDHSGATLARDEGSGLPSHSWRGGDILIQRASMTIPVDLASGEYPVAVGLASRADGARASVVDGAGGRVADAATTRTIKVNGRVSEGQTRRP